MSNTPLNFGTSFMPGTGVSELASLGFFGNALRNKRRDRVRRKMNRQARSERLKSGYQGMMGNAAGVPTPAINAVQNAVPNAVQPPIPNPFADQVNLAQQISAYDVEPSMGAAFTPAANEVANLQDPATRSFTTGSIGAVASDMFGTPLARQRSMSNKYIKK